MTGATGLCYTKEEANICTWLRTGVRGRAYHD